MQIELSYSRFFEPKQHSPELDDVLYHCVSHKLALRLTLNPAGVTLSSAPPEHRSRVLSLTGRWRSPLLEGRYSSKGALLLAPFIFLIEDLCLPHGSLYTLGRGDRSVADLFMRNFFFAACRREHVAFHRVTDGSNAAVTKGSRDLARRYHWIAKAYLKESVFNRSNAPELIVACGHLPLLEFSNPLLDAGAADLRRVSEKAGSNDALFEQKRAFLEARKRMLAAYRT